MPSGGMTIASSPSQPNERMKLRRALSVLWLLGLAVVAQGTGFSAEFQFRHHFIHRDLPITEKSTGDYGLTALVDVDHDGDLDADGRRADPPQRAVLVLDPA